MMEHKSKGVVFAVERAMLGVTIVIKEVPPDGLPDFTREDIQAIVRHFNTQPMPAELRSPEGYPSYRANLLVITEAMVTNAIEEARR
jgi:hypothetical protein